MPPDHEEFDCFEEAPVPLARLSRCNLPQRGLNSKHQRGVFRASPVARNILRSTTVGVYATSSIIRRVSGPPRRFLSRTLPDWVIVLPFATPPPTGKRPLTDGRVDALASCLLEGLRVREGGVVGTPLALEANDSQEDSMVAPFGA